MFLFSGRGYWQELIESILWAHNKLKVARAIQPRALSVARAIQPRALSITQGRSVRVSHYLLGGYCNHLEFLPSPNYFGRLETTFFFVFRSL
jgi:photosystem I P700 chlorophyll a apoprotein A1